MNRVHVSENAEGLAEAAAAFIHQRIIDGLKANPHFSLVLSGGNSPRRTYRCLAARAASIDWSKVDIFWGDERCVPHDHPDSNFRMARETLLSQLPVPPGNIHPMGCDPSPEAGARAYEAELHQLFPGQGLPRFDLVLLGLGGDGHTASLFPGTGALAENQRWVVANWVEKLDTWRLTLTLPVLNAAQIVTFLVEGGEKADILKQILEGSKGRFPAQRINPAVGEVHWFIDHDSGAGLQEGGTVGATGSA
jgi:6-phosphogluconolactonase